MNCRWSVHRRCTLCVIVVGCLWPSLASAQEPRFVGRTREEWVGEFESGGRRQRSHAAWAISQFAVQQAGPRDTMLWLNELYLLVETDSPSVRYWGVVGLGQFLRKIDTNHPARPTALAVLADTLKDPAASTRVAAAEALAGAGQPEQALPVLVEAMQSPQEATRIQAVKGLENLGEAARPARPTLERAASDSSQYVKRISARALERLNARGR